MKRKYCCKTFAANTGRPNKGLERTDDGVWVINGCCNGGCYVIIGVNFCPFCGANLMQSGKVAEPS